MKTRALLRAAAPVAAALLVAGTSASSQAAAPHNFAVGSGHILNQSLLFSITAHDLPQRLTGTAVVDFKGEAGKPDTAYSVRGPVTCLTVTGDHAVVGIRITTATGTAEPHIGNGFFMYVDDVARPGRDLYADSADNFKHPVQTGECKIDAPGAFEIQQGNVNVNEGQR
jgi:hypothetical protein